MAHFEALVLVPYTQSNSEGHVARVLAPYDSNLVVPPYRRYIDIDSVARWRKKYSDRNDQDIARELSTKLRTIAVDEHGFYEQTTMNPLGRWDYWLIGGLWDGLLTGSSSRVRQHEGNPHLTGRYIDPASYDARRWLAGNTIAVSKLQPIATWPYDVIPYAIITRTGVWHDVDTAGGSGLRDAIWITQAQDLLDEHVDCIAVVVDCHS